MYGIDATPQVTGWQPEERRPRLITAASGLVAAGGALFVSEVLLSADAYFTGMEVYEQGVMPNHGAFAAVGAVLRLVLALVGVLTGGALVVLAFCTFLGRRWARVASWVLGVPVLLYGALVLLAFLGSLVFSEVGSPGSPELARRYEQAWPSWLETLDIVLVMLVAVTLLTGLVCQAVPKVEAHFRARQRSR